MSHYASRVKGAIARPHRDRISSSALAISRVRADAGLLRSIAPVVSKVHDAFEHGAEDEKGDGARRGRVDRARLLGRPGPGLRPRAYVQLESGERDRLSHRP